MIAVIGAETSTPVVPEARDAGGPDGAEGLGEDDGESLIEGGLPLDAAESESELDVAHEESED